MRSCRRGRTVRLAIDEGFDHAWSAIIDTHVTTGLTAAILYPLATLGVIGGAGLAAAAYRHGRRARRWEHRRWREEQERNAQGEPTQDKPEPPKDNQ